MSLEDPRLHAELLDHDEEGKLKRYRALVLAIASISITSCAVRDHAPSGVVSAETWERQITYNHDPYKKTYVVKGGRIDSRGNSTFLRSTQVGKPAEKESIVAYVVSSQADWKFLDSANTIDGKSWPVTVVDREVSYCGRYGCSLHEHLAIHFDRAYLKSNIDEGVQLKLFGKRGEEIIYIPGNYILAFLASLQPAPKAQSDNISTR